MWMKTYGREQLCGLFCFKDKSISVLCCFTELPETCSKVHWFILCACDHVAVFRAKPTGVMSCVVLTEWHLKSSNRHSLAGGNPVITTWKSIFEWQLQLSGFIVIQFRTAVVFQGPNCTFCLSCWRRCLDICVLVLWKLSSWVIEQIPPGG